MSAYVSIPILAGISLFGGGIGAAILDLLEQRREERKQSEQQSRPATPVLIRPLSNVTGNPKSWKAWMFLTGCCLYALLGGATGYLQSEVMANYNGSSKTKGVQLVVYPIIVGISGMLLVLGVRLLPYDKYPRAGITTHIIVAGCFQMFAIIYCFSVVQSATIIFGKEAKITTVRRAFAYISVVGLVLSFLFGGYVMGKSAQLSEHEKNISSGSHDTTLTPKQVWAIKCWMAGLGGIQMSIGISVSVVTASGAAEANLFV